MLAMYALFVLYGSWFVGSRYSDEGKLHTVAAHHISLPSRRSTHAVLPPARPVCAVFLVGQLPARAAVYVLVHIAPEAAVERLLSS